MSTLERVHAGDLPFDRTIKVSLTERLTKEQISARMPHNLPTLRHLITAQKCDYAILINRLASPEAKNAGPLKILRRRNKMLHTGRGTQPAIAPSATAHGATGKIFPSNGPVAKQLKELRSLGCLQHHGPNRSVEN